MLRYILYFLAVYVILTVILVLLSIFDILPSNSGGFSIVITIASAYLPAYKFVKKLERAPDIKEKLIFGFGAAVSSEIIGLVAAFIGQFDLNFLNQIKIYAIVPLILILIKAAAAGGFFGFYVKSILKYINKK